MAGWCELRDAFRSFRLDRMEDVLVLDDRYEEEPGRTLQDYLRYDSDESERWHQMHDGGHGNPIDEMLRMKVIAVVGLSSDPSQPSESVARYLMNHGYRVIPVNPTERQVHGERGVPGPRVRAGGRRRRGRLPPG